MRRRPRFHVARSRLSAEVEGPCRSRPEPAVGWAAWDDARRAFQAGAARDQPPHGWSTDHRPHSTRRSLRVLPGSRHASSLRRGLRRVRSPPTPLRTRPPFATCWSPSSSDPAVLFAQPRNCLTRPGEVVKNGTGSRSAPLTTEQIWQPCLSQFLHGLGSCRQCRRRRRTIPISASLANLSDLPTIRVKWDILSDRTLGDPVLVPARLAPRIQDPVTARLPPLARVAHPAVARQILPAERFEADVQGCARASQFFSPCGAGWAVAEFPPVGAGTADTRMAVSRALPE